MIIFYVLEKYIKWRLTAKGDKIASTVRQEANVGVAAIPTETRTGSTRFIKKGCSTISL